VLALASVGSDGVDAPPTALACQNGGVEHHLWEAPVGAPFSYSGNSGQAV
jgi:hypothetical protein